MINLLKAKTIATYKAKPDLLNLAGIFTATLVIYWRVYQFRFIVGWDDQWFVLNYYTTSGLNFQNLADIVTEFFHGQYAPANQFYYTLLYSFFAYNPMYYHIGGLLIHVVNVTLVYFLVKKIAAVLITGDKTQHRHVALLTTLLFAISPINIEPVAWVAAAKVIIYALFYMCALHCYINYLVKNQKVYYYLTLFFFILSFGGKEQAVTLPLCMVLLDHVYHKNLKNIATWYNKIPFFLLAIAFGIITIQSQNLQKITDVANFYPWYQRLVLACYTFSEYLTKCVVPVNLSYIYPFPFKIGDPMPVWLWIFPVSIVVTIYCLWKLIMKKWVLFGLTFFLIHVLIVVNLVSLARHSITADRYVYVATIGIYFMIACLVCYIPQKTSLKKVVLCGAVIYCCYFITYAAQHITVWQNVVMLKKTIRQTISSRADFEAWKQQYKRNEKQH